MGYRLRDGIKSVFQHVTARGVNKQAIFLAERDYHQFLWLLGRYANRRRSKIHAFCLMPNHIHLLIRPQGDMSHLLRDILGSYARWFNQTYIRVGHLFQGRFHSRNILTNQHFLEAGRYIHMNPVAANLVSHPLNYNWSSFKHYCAREGPTWLDLSTLLRAHSDDPEIFSTFTTRTSAKVAPSPSIGTNTALHEIPLGSNRLEETDIGKVIELVASAFSCETQALRKSNRGSRPYGVRAVAIIALRHRLKISLAQAARILGYRSVDCAGNSVRSLLRKIDSSPFLLAIFNKLGLNESGGR